MNVLIFGIALFVACVLLVAYALWDIARKNDAFLDKMEAENEEIKP